MRLQNLLVPTDFSDVARNVYPCAANLGKRFDAGIHLVHFSSARNWGIPILNAEDPSPLDQLLRHEARHCELGRARITSCEVIRERISEAVPRIVRERRIDLAVIAKHGWTGALRFVAPSFSERLVRLASIPVLVIDPRTHKPIPPQRMTVLVPFDFTPAALSVLPAIQFLHAHFDARFHFLYVSGPQKGRMHFFQTLWLANGAEEIPVEQLFAALQRQALQGMDAELETRPGEPLSEILRRAGEMRPDLILVSTSGLLGNIAQSIVRHSDQSVLTWPVRRIHHDHAAAAAADQAPQTCVGVDAR
jgi:nucleotide-binding universal stress UspA family protein